MPPPLSSVQMLMYACQCHYLYLLDDRLEVSDGVDGLIVLLANLPIHRNYVLAAPSRTGTGRLPSLAAYTNLR